MSIHKSLYVGGALSTTRSVFTRRERIEKLMEKGDFEEGGSVFGLPKVRTQFKVLSKKQMKALASAQAEAVVAEGDVDAVTEADADGAATE